MLQVALWLGNSMFGYGLDGAGKEYVKIVCRGDA